jgi:hypothetical protein
MRFKYNKSRDVSDQNHQEWIRRDNRVEESYDSWTAMYHDEIMHGRAGKLFIRPYEDESDTLNQKCGKNDKN